MAPRIPCVVLRVAAAVAIGVLAFSGGSQQPSDLPTTGHFDPKFLIVKFAGEAEQNKAFDKPLGGGLTFRLAPNGKNWPTGWEIRIAPVTSAVPGEEAQDFVWVVTPPYRSSNARYLDTQYGITSKEAVAWSPREFSFVLSSSDYAAAKASAEKVLWPKTDQQEQEGLDELARIPVGIGTLAILDSRVAAGKGEGDFGSIDWIKFTVELHLPCSFPASKDLAPDRSVCAAPAKRGP